MAQRDLANTTVLLHSIPEALKEDLGVEVSNSAPYQWWNRHKNGELSIPMPDPEMYAGKVEGRSPVWKRKDIVAWYRAWKGM